MLPLESSTVTDVNDTLDFSIWVERHGLENCDRRKAEVVNELSLCSHLRTTTL